MNRTVDIMVAPEKVNDFADLMKFLQLKNEIFIENVQTLIDAENPKRQKRSGFDLTKYNELDEIYDHMESLAAMHPGKVEVIVGGTTFEGRQIKGVKVVA